MNLATTTLCEVLPGCRHSMVQRCFLLAVAFVFLGPFSPALALEWPSVSLPKEISGFDVGQEVTVNGLPMRLQGFVSAIGPAQLGDAFRRSLGKPLVENSWAGKLILGRVQGEHYLSVQIEPAGAGSRGIVAVTRIKHAYEARNDTEAKRASFIRRLPAGSQLLSDMSSVDGNKGSRYLVIVNENGAGVNRNWLKNLMSEDGFVFEREIAAEGKSGVSLSGALHGGATQFYKGMRKEAMATIYRDGNGRTTTVLNIVTSIERRE